MTSSWGSIIQPAAAAKSLQSCPTLCDAIDGSPQGSPVPGILRQERWSGLPFPSPRHESGKWKSEVSQSCLTLSDPHGFSRQEYWSGVPLPSPLGLSKSLQISFLFMAE